MSKKITTEEFIEKAKLVHGDRYDYTNVVYSKAKSSVAIICSVHGEFKQTPDKHLRGQNCPGCTGTPKYTKEEYISKVSLIHENKYKYNNLNYAGMHKKVIITCELHGDFTMTPAHHLHRKQGCPICKAEKARLSLEEFLDRSKNVHQDKYDYSLVKHTVLANRIEIICPIHGSFWQKAETHMRSHGCPSCGRSGYDSSKPGILYYLKITSDDGTIVYKIGITNKTVSERFNLTDLNKIEIIKQEVFANGQEALDRETEIKRKYKEHQYQGPNILESGNTELFVLDVLCADRRETTVIT